MVVIVPNPRNPTTRKTPVMSSLVSALVVSAPPRRCVAVRKKCSEHVRAWARLGGGGGGRPPLPHNPRSWASLNLNLTHGAMSGVVLNDEFERAVRAALADKTAEQVTDLLAKLEDCGIADFGSLNLHCSREMLVRATRARVRARTRARPTHRARDCGRNADVSMCRTSTYQSRSGPGSGPFSATRSPTWSARLRLSRPRAPPPAPRAPPPPQRPRGPRIRTTRPPRPRRRRPMSRRPSRRSHRRRRATLSG